MIPEGTGTTVLVHVTKAYGGVGGKTPPNHDLGTRWRWSIKVRNLKFRYNFLWNFGLAFRVSCNYLPRSPSLPINWLFLQIRLNHKTLLTASISKYTAPGYALLRNASHIKCWSSLHTISGRGHRITSSTFYQSDAEHSELSNTTKYVITPTMKLHDTEWMMSWNVQGLPSVQFSKQKTPVPKGKVAWEWN